MCGTPVALSPGPRKPRSVSWNSIKEGGKGMGKHRNRVAPSKHKGHGTWLVGALIGIVGVVFVVAWLGQSPAPVGTPEPPMVSSGLSSAPAVPAVARRETRPTLDPARFVGKATLGHQGAPQIPDVLDPL